MSVEEKSSESFWKNPYFLGVSLLAVVGIVVLILYFTVFKKSPQSTTLNTTIPTTIPTTMPTTLNTTMPTTLNTTMPTTMPTTLNTTIPTTMPTTLNTTMPTTLNTTRPTTMPTTMPTTLNTTIPTTLNTTTTSPVDCVMGGWINSGSCSSDGRQQQTRSTISPPLNGGRCNVPTSTSVPCPVDCIMGQWNYSGECNTTTGMIQQTRSTISPPLNGGTCNVPTSTIVPCPCNNRGTLIDGKCKCNIGISGSECQKMCPEFMTDDCRYMNNVLFSGISTSRAGIQTIYSIYLKNTGKIKIVSQNTGTDSVIVNTGDYYIMDNSKIIISNNPYYELTGEFYINSYTNKYFCKIINITANNNILASGSITEVGHIPNPNDTKDKWLF